MAVLVAVVFTILLYFLEVLVEGTEAGVVLMVAVVLVDSEAEAASTAVVLVEAGKNPGLHCA